MKDTLSEMWNRYNLLSSFKIEMNKKGYVARDMYIIQIQLDIIKKFIDIESMSVLNELIKKTYFRLLKSIKKGTEYLPDIAHNPENWVLNPIEKDKTAWISNDVMIFCTKTNCAVFSKISRNSEGYHYVDNKWQ
jgi:hypothetical protein